VLGLLPLVAVLVVLALPPESRWCDAGYLGLGREEQRKPGFVESYESAKYLVSSGRLKEANAQIKKLRKRAKGDLEKAMAEEALASYYLALRELSKAENHASAAVDKSPAFSAAFRTRAFIRRERGRLAAAEQDFRFALSFNGADTKSLRGLAELYLAEKRNPEALEIIQVYLDVDPLDAWAQDNWTKLMAVDLGYRSLPLDYLRCLKSTAVNRAELAAILVVALDRAGRSRSSADSLGAFNDSGGTGGAEYQSAGSHGIADSRGAWFTPFVERSLAMGLLRSYPDSTFRPYDLVRKAMLANELYSFLVLTRAPAVESVLERPAGSSVPVRYGASESRVPVSGYSDVNVLAYLWRPVRVAVELGILEPESETVFGADSTITGQEASRAAETLVRLLHSP
jgi:tetratricopeptide (TPR) repeat protein